MLAEDKDKKTNNQSDSQGWFDDLVSKIRLEEALYEVDLLEEKRKSIIEAMISGDDDFMHSHARKVSTNFFIKNLIELYFLQLAERNAKPNKLALELSNSKVLVWAEIKNDDEKTEDALILSAAKVNHDFSKYGFHISSTIVEEDDYIDVPNHYKNVTLGK